MLVHILLSDLPMTPRLGRLGVKSQSCEADPLLHLDDDLIRFRGVSQNDSANLIPRVWTRWSLLIRRRFCSLSLLSTTVHCPGAQWGSAGSSFSEFILKLESDNMSRI